MKRCADTFNDDRGLIIPITDKDLDLALARFPRYGTGGIEDILASKYKNIVFGIK